MTANADLSDRDGPDPLVVASLLTPQGAATFATALLAAEYVKSKFAEFGSQLGIAHMNHFLSGSGEERRYPDGSAVSNLVKASPEFAGTPNQPGQNAQVQAYIKQRLDQLVKSGSTQSGRIDVPPAILQGAGGRLVFENNPNLFFGVHGTQGLTISGNISVVNGFYDGTLTYTYYDTYGYGFTDTIFARLLGQNDINYAPATANTLMRFLQLSGYAHWFPVYVVVTVPFHQPDDEPTGGSGAPPVTPAISTALGFGSDPSVFFRYVLDNGTAISGTTTLGTPLGNIVLAPNHNYRGYFYARATNRSTVIFGRTGGSGTTFVFESGTSSVVLYALVVSTATTTAFLM